MKMFEINQLNHKFGATGRVTFMKRLSGYIPAIALTILIPLLSLIHPDRLPDTSAMYFAGLDKIIHLIMYALLTSSWALAMPKEKQKNMRRMLTLALMTALYGLFLEVCQLFFTTSRSLEALDAVANLTGAILAAMAVYWLKRGEKKEKRQATPQT